MGILWFFFFVTTIRGLKALLSKPASELTETDLSPRAGTPRSEGWDVDGYFYYWSTDNEGTAYDTNEPNGKFAVQWLFGGKSSVEKVGILGGGKESFGTLSSSSMGQRKGQVTCNGVNYDVPVALRVNSPSTDGIQTFQQFWSVRNPKKPAGGQISGTVDTACHFNAWKTAGLKMGTDYSFQILADERSSSTGSASITLSW
ncbi:hypothetical protein D9619_011882 [Psilocybe cf. subviscida]|uniref:endo-1,4-beta-xylanase n=1 Tax=Psilocybe cf. subviscida TaxID=2480587 RepID=A0A8H5B060_9AGAR|nr:hypothetical protein D9619_011882 [Psilocybe cf. subviscida]